MLTSDPQPGSAPPGPAETEAKNAVTYVTLSELARRWNVDRATARAAIRRANISPSDRHLSPRFSWDDVLRKTVQKRLPHERPTAPGTTQETRRHVDS